MNMEIIKIKINLMKMQREKEDLVLKICYKNDEKDNSHISKVEIQLKKDKSKWLKNVDKRLENDIDCKKKEMKHL